MVTGHADGSQISEKRLFVPRLGNRYGFHSCQLLQDEF